MIGRMIQRRGRWLAGAYSSLPAPLRRGLLGTPLLGPVLRGLGGRVIPSDGLRELEIAGGPLRGCRFLCEMPGDRPYYLGTYEEDNLAGIGDFIRPGDCVWDIGANHGYTTLLFARLAGEKGHVCAFEPEPGNVGILIRNIGLNSAEDRVTILSAAIGSESGTARLSVGDHCDNHFLEGVGGGAAYKTVGSIEVVQRSVDDLIAEGSLRPPDVIKLDVEGAELAALDGMKRCLATLRPRLMVEAHGWNPETASWRTAAPMFDALTARGYRLTDNRNVPVESAAAACHTMFAVHPGA